MFPLIAIMVITYQQVYKYLAWAKKITIMKLVVQLCLCSEYTYYNNDCIMSQQKKIGSIFWEKHMFCYTYIVYFPDRDVLNFGI